MWGRAPGVALCVSFLVFLMSLVLSLLWSPQISVGEAGSESKGWKVVTLQLGRLLAIVVIQHQATDVEVPPSLSEGACGLLRIF